MPVIINTLQKFRIICSIIRQRLTRADCNPCTLFSHHLLIYRMLQSDPIPSPKSKIKDSQTMLKISKEIRLFTFFFPGACKQVENQVASWLYKSPVTPAMTFLSVLPETDPWWRAPSGLKWATCCSNVVLPGWSWSTASENALTLNVQWIFSPSSKVIQQEKITFSKIVLEQIDK